MEQEAVVPTRDKIHVRLSRKLKEFSAPCKFGDKDAHEGFLECRPYRDANFEVFKSEIQTGIQARLIFFPIFVVS